MSVTPVTTKKLIASIGTSPMTCYWKVPNGVARLVYNALCDRINGTLRHYLMHHHDFWKRSEW